MNWRAWIWAGIVGVAVFLVWALIGLYAATGVWRVLCLVSALVGSVFVGWWILAWFAGATFPWDLTAAAVITAIVIPLTAVLYGASAGDDDTDQAQSQTAQQTAAAGTQPTAQPQVPPAVTPPLADAPGGSGILSMQAQDFDDSIRWAAQQGPRTGPTVQTVSLKPGPPFTKEDDGEGGGVISFRVPGAPRIIRTGWQAKQKEVFYISTPQGSIRNLQVGRRDIRNDETPWTAIRPGHTSKEKPLCWRNATVPEAELVFSTVAVPPGEYTIRAQKGVQPVEWGEYLPGGVKAGPVY